MKRYLFIYGLLVAARAQTSFLFSTPVTSLNYNFFYSGADWTGLCSSGTQQSPIDIPRTTKSPSPNVQALIPNDKIYFIAEQTPLVNVNISDSIRSIGFNYADGSLASWDLNGVVSGYQFQLFHFHAPSEHTFDNGKRYDVEMHVYYKTYFDNSGIALAIFWDVEAGGDMQNEFIESIGFKYFRNGITKVLVPEVPFGKLYKNLNMNKNNLYRYKGSTPIPPCTEGYVWYVVDDPQPISRQQLADINAKYKDNITFAGGRGNNRQTNPLYDRKIYKRVDTQTLLEWPSFGSLIRTKALGILFIISAALYLY